MKQTLFILLFSILSVSCSFASSDNVKVTASAPSQVVENQRFQLIFTIYNATADSFKLPKIKGLKLISGPSKSSSSNTQIVGGRIVSSTSVSLVYIAVADKKGTIKVPSANIWCNGTKYTTNDLTLTVTSQSDNQKKIEQKKSVEKKQSIPQASADEISGEDVFIRTEWESENVYENSHNNLIIKLYYRVNVAGWDNVEWPKCKNCDVTDAGVARNSRYGRAQVNGVLYNTVIVGKKDVVPSKTGKLNVSNGSLDVIVNVPNKNDFWGGYHRVSKNIVIPGVSVTVLPESDKKEEEKSDENPVELHWNL